MTITLYGLSMLGKRLKDILNREGITAYRLCKDLGLDQGQVSRFLNGKQNLALDKVERVVEYLGYDLELVKRPSRKGR